MYDQIKQEMRSPQSEERLGSLLTKFEINCTKLAQNSYIALSVYTLHYLVILYMIRLHSMDRYLLLCVVTKKFLADNFASNWCNNLHQICTSTQSLEDCINNSQGCSLSLVTKIHRHICINIGSGPKSPISGIEQIIKCLLPIKTFLDKEGNQNTSNLLMIQVVYPSQIPDIQDYPIILIDKIIL